MESSASHIYESALLLSPSPSPVRALYEDKMSTDVKTSGLDYSWDACTRTIKLHYGMCMGYSRPQECMKFSHKNDKIAVCKEEVVEIFETMTGQRRATLTTDSPVFSLTFSPDDAMLMT
jgi:WD40 repeat protein